MSQVVEWFTNVAGSSVHRIDAIDDDADRAPITLVVVRENISGMLLSRV